MNPEYFTQKEILEKNAVDGQCIICQKPLPKFKRKYCSDDCFRNWFNQFSSHFWGQTRDDVFTRDNYTCVKCGKHMPSSLLVADHIKPIALGGEEWNMQNIQTLCVDCNSIKTKEDLRTIASYRKAIRNKQASLPPKPKDLGIREAI